MATLREAAQDFLSRQQIAVAGVSSLQPDAANAIYRKLRETGHTVYAINPKVTEVEGDPCYPDLKSTPQVAEAVMIVTPPQASEDLVRQCDALGIRLVWMHKSLGNSVSPEAVQFCQEHDITVIPGACPMMFCEPVDIWHQCMRGVMSWTGRIPSQV
jgi:hypothetical protein